MELVNKTAMVAGYTLGMDASGREQVVVVVKGTFSIPEARGEQPELLAMQVPLIEADVFTGEPGVSALLLDVDYAPVKRHCDVTLIGTAYAPNARRVDKVLVGFKVGTLSKTLNIMAERVWMQTGEAYTPSNAEPFISRPITYDIAYGGVDRFSDDNALHMPYWENPVGVGYHHVMDENLIVGTPAPSTEEPDNPVVKPDGHYKPMSLGPVSRSWKPRMDYAGTYDENWMDNRFPFLPDDFDDLYYQAAPADQQMLYPKGGENVQLLNVTPDGRRSFNLPARQIPVLFSKRNGESITLQASLDTIVFEPDANRFTLTWRASMPLVRNIFELPQAVIGPATDAFGKAIIEFIATNVHEGES